MINQLLILPRSVKKGIFLLLDLILILFAYWFAWIIRVDIATEIFSTKSWLLILLTAAFSMACFIRLGLYRAVIRYINVKMITTTLIGSVLSVTFLVVASYFIELKLPRSVPVIYFLLLLVSLSGTRLAIRGLLQSSAKQNGAPVLIYGAGQSGRQLLEAIRHVHEYNAVAFVDDNKQLHKTTIHGINVFDPNRIEYLIDRYAISKILLAIPSANKEERKKIIHRLEPLPCEVLSIPGMLDLVEGKVSITSLRKISVEDLLGREPVQPMPELLTANIHSKIVMVTGAGGSIGSELCRQIIHHQPSLLILYELSEFSLYSIDKELHELIQTRSLSVPIVSLLGSVQNRTRLNHVMQQYHVQTIYHAAAYKHVPMVEHNTIEGIQNNVFGTWYCAQAALDARVETFVLISTDKAVRPTNTMGASKRMAELVLQALSQHGGPTRFCMVRFGNVLGSSGSVVPVFQRQIEQGGPVTLTHPEITRFFMTIPEASQLVIQAGAMGQGGDVFVLDMGESVKIIDLARQMIRLSGFEPKDEQHPEGDIEIRITGLRPGEKLYEELLIGDDVSGTEHPRILTANEAMLPWPQLQLLLDDLQAACEQDDQPKIRQLLMDAPTGFKPKDTICDQVWLQGQQQAALPASSE